MKLSTNGRSQKNLNRYLQVDQQSSASSAYIQQSNYNSQSSARKSTGRTTPILKSARDSTRVQGQNQIVNKQNIQNQQQIRPTSQSTNNSMAQQRTAASKGKTQSFMAPNQTQHNDANISTVHQTTAINSSRQPSTGSSTNNNTRLLSNQFLSEKNKSTIQQESQYVPSTHQQQLYQPVLTNTNGQDNISQRAMMQPTDAAMVLQQQNNELAKNGKLKEFLTFDLAQNNIQGGGSGGNFSHFTGAPQSERGNKKQPFSKYLTTESSVKVEGNLNQLVKSASKSTIRGVTSVGNQKKRQEMPSPISQRPQSPVLSSNFSSTFKANGGGEYTQQQSLMTSSRSNYNLRTTNSSQNEGSQTHRPMINKKSEQILAKKGTEQLPIYSSKRQQLEADQRFLKQQYAKKKREEEEMLKKQKEDDEIKKNQITRPDAKLDKDKFNKRYNEMVNNWQVSKIKNQNKQEEQPSFTPKINTRSKKMAHGIQRIEERVQIVQNQKQQKLQELKTVVNNNNNSQLDINDHYNQTGSKTPNTLLSARSNHNLNSTKNINGKPTTSPRQSRTPRPNTRQITPHSVRVPQPLRKEMNIGSSGQSIRQNQQSNPPQQKTFFKTFGEQQPSNQTKTNNNQQEQLQQSPDFASNLFNSDKKSNNEDIQSHHFQQTLQTDTVSTSSANRLSRYLQTQQVAQASPVKKQYQESKILIPSQSTVQMQQTIQDDYNQRLMQHLKQNQKRIDSVTASQASFAQHQPQQSEVQIDQSHQTQDDKKKKEIQEQSGKIFNEIMARINGELHNKNQESQIVHQWNRAVESVTEDSDVMPQDHLDNHTNQQSNYNLENFVNNSNFADQLAQQNQNSTRMMVSNLEQSFQSSANFVDNKKNHDRPSFIESAIHEDGDEYGYQAQQNNRKFITSSDIRSISRGKDQATDRGQNSFIDAETQEMLQLNYHEAQSTGKHSNNQNLNYINNDTSFAPVSESQNNHQVEHQVNNQFTNMVNAQGVQKKQTGNGAAPANSVNSLRSVLSLYNSNKSKNR